MSNEYQVFNPGVPAPVSITLTFQSVADAAWIEFAVLEAKRTGRLSSLMVGILRSSLREATTSTIEVDGRKLTPEEIKSSL